MLAEVGPPVEVHQYVLLIGVWAVAVVAPGPDTVVVLRQSIVGSRTSGLAAAAGIVVGIALWIVLAMAGVAALVSAHPALLPILQVLGGGFLVILGVSGLRAKPSRTAAAAHGRSFWIGLATNLANPKALVFFAAVFATLVPVTASLGERTAVFAILVTGEWLWFSMLAVFASSHGGWLSRKERPLNTAASLVIAALGGASILAGAATLSGVR
ncbi:LysE family translocator [Hoyosella rhizosphaerae]|uniref:LysE family translocator n=1 Tax=Hoyosella rhizosphaerae TaxID=1755582 RepID=A0A916X906_9ACTN|nr:LysE family translocator [Hoyosella rhizosphaerae]MBN4927178.1 LysE family translocator [Hoyosella rhizosphaerae]GGC53392.1 hypothetical protein GCM10011410_02180 [Hoyosella rhizosphaerae]